MAEDATGAAGAEGGTGAAGGQSPQAQSKQGGEKPPWGDDFDAERAWSTIKTLREAEKERNTLKSEVQKLQDRDKSEGQRLQDERDREKSRADSAESRLIRFEVAADKGIPPKLANRLQGSTRAELEEDADRLKADFGLTDDGGEGGAGRRAPDFDAGVRNGGSKPVGMNEIIRAGFTRHLR